MSDFLWRAFHFLEIIINLGILNSIIRILNAKVILVKIIRTYKFLDFYLLW